VSGASWLRMSDTRLIFSSTFLRVVSRWPTMACTPFFTLWSELSDLRTIWRKENMTAAASTSPAAADAVCSLKRSSRSPPVPRPSCTMMICSSVSPSMRNMNSLLRCATNVWLLTTTERSSGISEPPRR